MSAAGGAGIWRNNLPRGVNLGEVTLSDGLRRELPDALVQRTGRRPDRDAPREALMRPLLSDGHFLKVAGALKSMSMPVLDIGRADPHAMP
jgi:hypothetical protein